MLVVLGVLLPVFMGSLDTTILASALPTIGREFGDVHNLPWLVTAYLIANTSITALYGKISDIHGRRVTLLIAISLYMLGSLVCALAPNMIVLILGRVLHGLGGGGLTSTGMVVLGDVAAPKERGKYYGYFSVVYTTAGAFGPALGGSIAEYLHWSVIFWMNIPLGLIAVALTLTLLRHLPRHDRPHKLDFLGAALIMAASSSFMLALSMGGVNYPWLSTPILALFAAALSCSALPSSSGCAPRRSRSSRCRSCGNREARLAIAANAFGWGPIVGLQHLPADVSAEHRRHGAGQRGLERADARGHAQHQRRHHRNHPAAARALQDHSDRRSDLGDRRGADAGVARQEHDASGVRGAVVPDRGGFGCMPPLSATALQNNVSIHTFGSAVATMQFSRNLFATILVAVFGVIVLSGVSQAGGRAGSQYSVEGFVHVFLAVAASFAAALAAVVLLDEKPLETKHSRECHCFRLNQPGAWALGGRGKKSKEIKERRGDDMQMGGEDGSERDEESRYVLGEEKVR